MTKRLTEKQLRKIQSKQEREKITKRYLDKIQKIIDEEYINMAESIEDFNKELEESAVKYGDIKNQIYTLLKAENISNEMLEKAMLEVSEIESNNNEIYKTITSRDLQENKLLRHLPIIAERVASVINQAEKDLIGHKNQAYIHSMVINRSFDIFRDYNSYIVDTALESNDYIDMYIDSREDFLDFIEKCRKELEERISAYENHEQTEAIIEENIKYNQRLRVDYTDLCDFLRHKGYECNRQGSTTHAVWKHKETGHSVPLPNKSGTIPQGTTSKVLKQIGSSRNELAQYLYN